MYSTSGLSGMTYPFDPPPDDGPIDPNPNYGGPPPSSQYHAPAPPPAGYQGSYPPPWDSGRPSGLMAASVLAYINAGLLILAGLLLLIGASAIDSWNEAFGSSDHGYTAELAFDGLINFIAAGLQIAGGVMMSGRNERGRTVLTLGGAICVLAGLYWVLRVHDSGVVVWAGIFVAMPVIGMSMAWTERSTIWLRGADPRQAPPLER